MAGAAVLMTRLSGGLAAGKINTREKVRTTHGQPLSCKGAALVMNRNQSVLREGSSLLDNLVVDVALVDAGSIRKCTELACPFVPSHYWTLSAGRSTASDVSPACRHKSLHRSVQHADFGCLLWETLCHLRPEQPFVQLEKTSILTNLSGL